MISSISLTACLSFFAIGNAQDTITCDTGAAIPLQAGILPGETATLNMLIDTSGLFVYSGCDADTTTDFAIQIRNDLGQVISSIDDCMGTADCEAPESCVFNFNEPPTNFMGFLDVINVGDETGSVQLTATCDGTTTTPPMMMSSTDSTDSPDSTDSTDSDSDSESDESLSLESESSESGSGSASSLVEVESADDGEANGDGRNSRLNAVAVEQKAGDSDSLPFLKLIWFFVGVFVFVNFGLCFWLYKKSQKSKPQVSFGEPKHAVLEMQVE